MITSVCVLVLTTAVSLRSSGFASTLTKHRRAVSTEMSGSRRWDLHSGCCVFANSTPISNDSMSTRTTEKRGSYFRTQSLLYGMRVYLMMHEWQNLYSKAAEVGS